MQLGDRPPRAPDGVKRPVATAVQPADVGDLLIGEIEPAALWERILRNRRGAVVARCIGRNTSAVVCRLRFRLGFSNAI